MLIPLACNNRIPMACTSLNFGGFGILGALGTSRFVGGLGMCLSSFFSAHCEKLSIVV